MSGETLRLPSAPASTTADVTAATAVGNATTLLNGIIQTAIQPSVTTLPNTTSISTNVNFPNGNLSLDANVDVAELYVYNSDLYPTSKSGVMISQGSVSGDAQLTCNSYGSKATIGIDQSDSYKFKISRGQSLDANPIISIDPNYVASATAVSTWTTRTSAADNTWFGVCWAPELRLFCAISFDGNSTHVMTSPNGITWTLRTSAADIGWRAICWSPELRLFCATASSGTGNRIMTSPDGINWTSRTNPADNDWVSICWSSELRLFCAVANTGTGNRIMTSPDGITWTLRTSAADIDWRGICWSPELRLFCAVGNGTGNGVMTSPNGITWTSRASAANNQWRSVCWASEINLFCAVAQTGTGNRVMTSTDGINWTTRTSASDSGWQSVCWSTNLKIFCAAASTGNIMTSPDGITWTSRTAAAANSWNSICWSSELGVFCAVASSGTGNRVQTSTNMYSNLPNVSVNGTLSTTNISNTIYPINGNLSLMYNKDVAELYVYNSDLLPTTKSGITIHQGSSTGDAHLQFNAYGTKNTIGIDTSDNYKFKISRGPSVDANPLITLDPNYVSATTAVTTWTARTSAADIVWQGICWSPELRLFCAVARTGAGNRVMTSPNGITWTSRTSAADNNWQGVCWSPELRLFCAVARSGTGNRVMTSPDGVTWTTRTSAADAFWWAVCWSPELRLFCAVAAFASANSIMTSPDGITWTLRTSATTNDLRSICWSPDLRLFCVVGDAGAGNRVMTSPDGINWTARSSAADNVWWGVTWSPELRLFCAVSTDGNVMTSPDGITWTSRTASSAKAWNAISWSSELKIFSVTANIAGGGLMTSPDGITWTDRTPSSADDWAAICWAPELGIFAAVSQSGTGNRVMTSVNMYGNTPNVTVAGIRGKTTGVADAIQVVIDSTGQLGTVSSSETKKHDIRPMADFTDRLYSLDPVIFKWKPEICQDQTDQYGLIAERVAEVFPELAVKDPNDVNYLTVAYQNLIVMLLNEIKKLKIEYSELREEVMEL